MLNQSTAKILKMDLVNTSYTRGSKSAISYMQTNFFLDFQWFFFSGTKFYKTIITHSD
jgi:hypothetical protein